MYPPRQTNPLRTSLVRCFSALVLALLPLALSPLARAVTPAPDGGYPGQNTAEGQDALFSLTAPASDNTAVGFNALHDLTTGSLNTALGSQALAKNTGSGNVATGSFALFNNTSGTSNVAVSAAALFSQHQWRLECRDWQQCPPK